MLSLVSRVFVHDAPDIDRVIEEVIKSALRELHSMDSVPGLGRPIFSFETQFVDSLTELLHRLHLKIGTKDCLDCLCFPGIDHELPIYNIVSKRWNTTHPDTLFLRSGDLIPNALSGYFALELGE